MHILKPAYLCGFLILLPTQAFGGESVPGNGLNPTAVKEVVDGKRTTANASWWGFDAIDATKSLQDAIDSNAKKVVVPYMGKPWIIRPIKLRGKLELVFEPGVLVLAKKGEFKGGGDSLFSARDVSGITIRGYGATLRMRKRDYQSPVYKKAEWRMGLRFMGCKQIHVEGLRIESSGGDGIYIGSSGKNRWCLDVTVRNCTCHDNYRQGMSVISVQNLTVENCVFSGTDGTAPEAGIDFEPDSADERLVNCVVRNSVFESNSGHAILVYLKPLTSKSEPVSIRFENCVSRMGRPGMSPEDFKDPKTRGWAGMAVGAARDDGPQGLVEFINCTAENTGKEGAKVFDKSAESVKVRFVNCNWKNSWVSTHRRFGGPRVPVLIHLRRPSLTKKPGGVEFVNCTIYDDKIGPAVQYESDKGDHAVCDLKGTITVHNRYGTRWKLGNGPKDVALQILDAKSIAEKGRSALIESQRLRSVDRERIKHLVKMLTRPSAGKRRRAAQMLGRIAEISELDPELNTHVVQSLKKLLKTEQDAKVKKAARDSLEQLQETK